MRKIEFGSDEEFIKNYQLLKSSRKMGELYNCDKGTITKHAKEIGYNYSQNKEIKITNVPIKEIINLYEELGSAKKVGEKYDCSGTAVANYLKKNNYNLVNKNAKLKDIDKEEFINNYEKLKSAEALAKLYNCSSTAILNYAKKINYDVNLNKKYKLSEQDKKEIIKQYNYKTSTELSKEYGVSRGMITKIWYDNKLIGKELKDFKTTEIDIKNKQFGKWKK